MAKTENVVGKESVEEISGSDSKRIQIPHWSRWLRFFSIIASICLAIEDFY